MNRFFYSDRVTNFLAASEREILGALAAETSVSQTFSLYGDHVFEPILCNADGLSRAMAKIIETQGADIDLSHWAHSRYMPTPTIIQAASALYLHHSVEDITRSEASGENLQCTSELVMKAIDYSQANKEKSICFVTGVPGAGKTLVGLNIAVRQFEKKNLAVYLSGNRSPATALTNI